MKETEARRAAGARPRRAPRRPSGHPRRTLPALAVAGSLLLFVPSAAWGYIDPVSGSVILQILAAAFLAGLLSIKRIWTRCGTALRALRERMARR